ncbi:MAG: ABC transporter permease [Peptostreptococcaceae bacterium]
MQVYKAFFKVISKNLIEISIYVVIFLFFTVILGNATVNPEDTNFEDTKVDIAFINNDEESTLVNGIRTYLEGYANIVDIKDNKKDLQDSLFFREAVYIVRIPKGFTNKVLAGEKNIEIEKHTLPNSIDEVYMNNLINRYLNTAKMYIKAINNISEEELVQYVSKDLSNNTNVEMSTYSNGYIVNSNCKNYFNYLAYSMFAILILGVSSVMMAFNKKDLKMRNLSSALSLKNMSFQMILGNITFAKIVWLIMVFTSFVLYGSYMFSFNGLLFLLNSLIFTMAALSISLLIGNLVNSKNAMSAAANVVSLGSCFISGVLVPQNYLSDTVISIAKFNPTYWYVKANNDISVLVNYSNENMTPIFMSMLIVLGFSLAILAVTLVVMKQKRLKNY